jgi:hypothetical protein
MAMWSVGTYQELNTFIDLHIWIFIMELYTYLEKGNRNVIREITSNNATHLLLETNWQV